MYAIYHLKTNDEIRGILKRQLKSSLPVHFAGRMKEGHNLGCTGTKKEAQMESPEQIQGLEYEYVYNEIIELNTFLL